MQLGYEPQIILSGRRINDGMSEYIAKRLIQQLLAINKNINSCKVLIMGATFKENVSDIRNSKVFDLYNELKDYNIQINIIDPFADAAEVEEEYGVHLSSDISNDYDGVIVTVPHRQYLQLDETFFMSICKNDAVIVDIKNILKDKIKNLNYWSL
jgi:UDP-N-acetyl-D-galactosamine dehydrogenase